MNGCADRAGDAAAYVLGALEADEARAFLRHVDECAICREELEQFGQIARVLPMAAPQYEAPRGLKRAVMKEISGAAAPRRVPARRLGTRPIWSPLPRWSGVLAGGLAAAAAAVVLTVSGSGPDSHTLAAQVVGVPGSAQLRLTGQRAELILRHFREPSSGHIYEVWTKRPGGAIEPTTALFAVTAAGAADVTVPGKLPVHSQVMVTQEPAGGSQRPTTSPIIVASLD